LISIAAVALLISTNPSAKNIDMEEVKNLPTLPVDEILDGVPVPEININTTATLSKFLLFRKNFIALNQLKCGDLPSRFVGIKQSVAVVLINIGKLFGSVKCQK